ncbi:hypothetical protein [Deinococcus yavapaiensis]|uniref:Uncharacterized protein n=1 Tax=Deinococcus yavapaiensis KR-236 TaxID=694435 RepID=A0A318S396_9DEIO|nr:hypothetical protein [Deinococcus yavapaiensis]PYE50489.1 hypothetical protein DES52_1177 [Deinococcus yavapaiensis KR-236]
MQTSTRKGIALIAASLLADRAYLGVRSHDDDRSTNFTGRIGLVTNVYDDDRSVNISGSFRDGQYELYDWGTETRLSLQLQDRAFSGRDALSGRDFNSVVDQRHVTLFDSETQRHHEFTLR